MEIQLKFIPLGFYWGLAISVLTLLVLVAAGLTKLREQRYRFSMFCLSSEDTVNYRHHNSD